MKHFIKLFCAILFISCSSQKESSLPVALDLSTIEHAARFVRSHFESCKTQNYIPITKDIAVPYLVRSLTVEEMKIACAEINQKYGELAEFKIEQTFLQNELHLKV